MSHAAQPILLYLEDDSALRDLVSMVMANRGFKVIPVHSLRDARKHVDDHRLPDVFLFDLALKDAQDGFEFALELCQRHDIAHSRFFFLSAFTDVFAAPPEFHVDHVFSKPIPCERFDELAKALHDAALLGERD